MRLLVLANTRTEQGSAHVVRNRPDDHHIRAEVLANRDQFRQAFNLRRREFDHVWLGIPYKAPRQPRARENLRSASIRRR